MRSDSTISVQMSVRAGAEKLWKLWTSPEHIIQFNNPMGDWHTPRVEIDLKEGGRFYYRMESRDGANGFDFAGVYDKIILNKYMEYTGDDGRWSAIRFSENGDETLITEVFEPDDETPLEIQRNFVQGLLDSFKVYAELHGLLAK